MKIITTNIYLYRSGCIFIYNVYNVIAILVIINGVYINRLCTHIFKVILITTTFEEYLSNE